MKSGLFSPERNVLKITVLIAVLSFSLVMIKMPQLTVSLDSSPHLNKNSAISTFATSDSLKIHVIFINYDATLINTTSIQQLLPRSINLTGNEFYNETFRYDINYSFHFANDSYTAKFLNFIASIANTNDNTATINWTSLNQQAIDGHPRKIFLPQNGTSISAESVEEWFHQNPYLNTPDNQYYVLNLSYFDTTDHSREHWFTVKEIDPDSGVQRHWWRNEWDFPINFDAKFPYAGYSSKYHDYFFDPFAFQWYTQWDLTWRGYDPSMREYYQKDLDQYLRDGGDVNRYVGQWLADLMFNHFSVGYTRLGNSVDIQLVVFQNVSHLGFTNANFTWVINMSHFLEVLNEILPNAIPNITITFTDFASYPELQAMFDNVDVTSAYNGSLPIPKYKYYSGMNLWGELMSSPSINAMFENTTADIQVRGFAFILDNATFAEPGMWAGGGLYTGLGGGGRMIQLMELDRLYYPNRTTPRQGFSRVVIHETGHAIGLPHSFSYGMTASDFIGDVMGYFPGVIKYSRMLIEAYQRHAVNLYKKTLINPLLEQVQAIEYQLNGTVISHIQEFIQNSTELHLQHSYYLEWRLLSVDFKGYLEAILSAPPPSGSTTSLSTGTSMTSTSSSMTTMTTTEPPTTTTTTTPPSTTTTPPSTTTTPPSTTTTPPSTTTTPPSTTTTPPSTTPQNESEGNNSTSQRPISSVITPPSLNMVIISLVFLTVARPIMKISKKRSRRD